jgi:hypothetical protein
MHGHMNVTMHGHMNVTMHGHMNVNFTNTHAMQDLVLSRNVLNSYFFACVG